MVRQGAAGGATPGGKRLVSLCVSRGRAEAKERSKSQRWCGVVRACWRSTALVETRGAQGGWEWRHNASPRAALIAWRREVAANGVARQVRAVFHTRQTWRASGEHQLYVTVQHSLGGLAVGGVGGEPVLPREGAARQNALQVCLTGGTEGGNAFEGRRLSACRRKTTGRLRTICCFEDKEMVLSPILLSIISEEKPIGRKT